MFNIDNIVSFQLFSPLAPTTPTTYENSTYRIKIQYPSDWSVEGASNSSVVASFYSQVSDDLYYD